MANTLKNHPSFPSNYVTILDLKERWLKQQEQEAEAETETTKKRDIAVDGENSVKSKPQVRNYDKPKPSGKPKLSRESERRGLCRNPNRSGTTLQYRVVKVSQETREIQDEVGIGAEIDDRDEVKYVKKKKKKKKRMKKKKRVKRIEEIEAKMEEVFVAEKEVQVTGAQDNVVQEKHNLVTKSKKKEKEKGDVKVPVKRVFETRNRNVLGGRRGHWNRSERRRLNSGGEGNRNKGFMWVKKGESFGKSNNCCAVEGGLVD